MKAFTSVLSLTLVGSISLSAASAAEEAKLPEIRGAEVITGFVVPTVFEGDLRDLPKSPTWRPGDPIREIPKVRYNADPPLSDERVRDPLMDLQNAVPKTRGVDYTEFINMEGQGFNGFNPPDPDGDVGPDYYIQAINASRVTIYNKGDGTVASGPFDLDSLGSGLCASGLGDPIVLYDELAERWFLSEFSSAGNALCVYTSRTADPVAGGWCAYQFVPGGGFPDYPKYAVWPEMFAVTANQGASVPVMAMDRTNMYSTDGTTCPTARPMQRLTVSDLSAFGFESLTPADLDGPAPPADTPAIFARHRDTEAHGPGGLPSEDQLELWDLTVDFDNAANTVLTGPQVLSVSEFSSDLCGFTTFSCLNQPGGANLDPLREVFMNRLQYRNFGTHEVLFGNFTTNTDPAQSGADDAGVRWVELRRTGGPWSLFQEGTVSVNDENRWMAGTSMDADGNAVAVYIHSDGTSIFPSHRYSGRLAGDPAGTMPRGEESIVDGGGSNSSLRYGDYSDTSVDPSDGCTFWWTGEYNPTSQWSTRISAFKFNACTGGGAIFTDGFESGDTSAWSASVP